jgi:hypothetical protein
MTSVKAEPMSPAGTAKIAIPRIPMMQAIILPVKVIVKHAIQFFPEKLNLGRILLGHCCFHILFISLAI